MRRGISDGRPYPDDWVPFRHAPRKA